VAEKTNIKVAVRGARLPVLYFSAALAASAVHIFLMVSCSRTISEAAGELHDRHYKLLTAPTGKAA
jgi:hypothetical protein